MLKLSNNTALFHVRQKRKPSNGKGIRQEKACLFRSGQYAIIYDTTESGPPTHMPVLPHTFSFPFCLRKSRISEARYRFFPLSFMQ